MGIKTLTIMQWQRFYNYNWFTVKTDKIAQKRYNAQRYTTKQLKHVYPLYTVSQFGIKWFAEPAASEYHYI